MTYEVREKEIEQDWGAWRTWQATGGTLTRTCDLFFDAFPDDTTLTFRLSYGAKIKFRVKK